MNREKDLMMYGIVGVLLLASFLMLAPANQYQKVFAQTENATDVEIPKFENGTATFVPPPENEREAPPVPSNAIKAADLPKETPPKDPDSEPLSVTNRTELLEVLPANSTKIIEHVDDDLKNSTGEGLLPPAIMDKIKSGEGQGQGNKTILDISSPKELDEIKNFSDSTTNQTAEQALDEGEPISNATNATAAQAAPETQTGGEATNATNATAAQAAPETQTGGEATNATNATGGETPSQSREEAKQTEGEKEQAKTGAEEQALAGTPEASNMTNATNATGGETPSQTGKEQKQTGGGEETTTIIGKQKQTGGGEETTTIIGKQKQTGGGEETSQNPPNATNATSMLNATDSKDGNDNPEDGG
jgi:hypothetical protein